MRFSEQQLPSNEKFGFFFTFVFFAAGSYFFFSSSFIETIICILLAITLFLITLVKSSILQSLNTFWMRFGFLIGKIISPIIIGLLFFFLITPIAIVIKLGGRDELRLKFKKKKTHWIKRDKVLPKDSFKYQF